MLTLTDHWIDQARRVPSPNFNERPDPDDIALVVIHNISLPPERFGGAHIEAFFQNRLDPDADPYFQTIRDLKVSSHFLIRRDGELVQFVACDRRAWHAGVSSWRGRDNCNDFALGIELEGADHIPYEEAQYRRLNALLDALIAHYPRLSRDTITGHEHIAPGRKTDPGPAFDWSRL
ncbi:1,6-anhydro-N-acetylmuramyl-L-alanine amidase AmpD [Alloalcanivorax profundimaris]|uniref:1,6-anhydro-N-acetylmuramyl-L-alanine amidase AmpD n=1 Tax=Alloalcanivorax profundimaris TaxID=2735259 RepID=UPI0018882317|nr:1,6-anhydro-N-acetylmuramyl-L-alanine amidase AmpD [Alloalcanivorax profundimaris]MBF1800771.1 1,6-anhydro-N-acetylmuramyl-L-alanine amidase AmpD [Alloalcanivorax profundimaris]MCQ6262403.1 1,6-anhydro-N-acetylmuramyl-L-alanine amidase AmpD [Alcanivorax sp. MM125-6]